MAGAAGLSYEFAPKTFDYVNVPADFGRIQDPMAAYLMKTVAIDYTGFDALAAMVRPGAAATGIGATEIAPGWQQGIEITRSTATDPVGRYLLSEMTAAVAGVTRRNGEPCALIWFAAEGNNVAHDFATGPVTMRFEGTECFWGEVAVSLRDGRVVGGALRGALPWRMEMGLGKEAPKEMPVYGVVGQVSMWEVPAERGN